MTVFCNTAQLNHLQKQSGAALFVSLILLLALTIIGLSAASRSNLQERMAANMHIQNLAFNAAESAIGGFVVDSITGDSTKPGHTLYDLRVKGSLTSKCYNSTGVRADCGSVFLDGDRGSAITSRVDVKVLGACTTACRGMSLSSGYGCRVFQVDGTGSVGTRVQSNTLWVQEITACPKR